MLEIRALDAEHVYLRVAWINRPEDLLTGRQPHHHIDELIPSNEMDVIDARSVEGPVEVTHWGKHPRGGTSSDPARHRYFWRQSYNYVSKQFSPTSITAGTASSVT